RAMLAAVKAKCPELREALVLEDGWDALQRDAAQTSVDSLRDLEDSLQFDDAINIQYTSGTTGFPKGATLTHHNIVNNGMFIGELEHPRFGEFDFSSLRTGIMAGSPCPVEVMKKVQTVMHIPEMTIAYGMTETSPVSTQCATDDPLEKRVSTVGRVHPHVEIKIVDPATGAVVDRGSAGELCSRGYMVMP